mgnify:CR=1 FL=1
MHEFVNLIKSFLQNFSRRRSDMEVQWRIFLCRLRPVRVPYTLRADYRTSTLLVDLYQVSILEIEPTIEHTPVAGLHPWSTYTGS